MKRLGSYVVFEPFARGGMAQVHYGLRRGAFGFARVVAVKRALPDRLTPDVISLMTDEARTVARLVHPNVVQLIDVIDEDKELFFVMEYVHGDSLAHLLKAAANAGERAPPAVVSAIVCDLLRGLGAAHEATSSSGEPLGLVHRDVSPENVLVDVHGVARIADFGIAKSRERIQSTGVGQLKGKAAYMAPEQVHGKATPLSDVFAAGIVLWEALTGERLFTGDEPGAVLASVMSARVSPPSSRAEGVPVAFDAIVRRALQRSPARRFASASEMEHALREAAPPASAVVVGQWVAKLAASTIEERERRTTAIQALAWEEEDGSRATPSEHALPSSVPRESTRIGGRSRPTPLVVGAMAIATAAVVVALAVRGADRDEPSSKAGHAPMAGASVSSAPPAATNAQLDERPSAETDSASSSVAAAPANKRPSSAAKHVGRAPSGTGVSDVRPSCDPPFVVDGSGRKVYTRGCF